MLCCMYVNIEDANISILGDMLVYIPVLTGAGRKLALGCQFQVMQEFILVHVHDYESSMIWLCVI